MAQSEYEPCDQKRENPNLKCIRELGHEGEHVWVAAQDYREERKKWEGLTDKDLEPDEEASLPKKDE